ncbi:hypothetical protein, partial [Saccharibacter floricola]|uniref:hypothetical protein n=1 Tax=Saccharibacter floricola TaxID=231053 RepID=UPI0022318C02
QGGLANTVNLSAGTGEVFQGGSVTNYNANGGNALIDSGGYVNTFTVGPANNTFGTVQAGANVNTLAATGYGTAFLNSGASVASAVTPANGNGDGGILFLSGTAGTVSGTDNGIIETFSGASFSNFSLNGATAYLNGGSFATPPTVTGNGG